MLLIRNYIKRIPYYLNFIFSKISFKFLKLLNLEKSYKSIHNKFLVENKVKEINKNGICYLELDKILNNLEIKLLFEEINKLKNKKVKTYEKEYLKNFIGGDFIKRKKINFNLDSNLFQLSINPTLLNIVNKYFNYYTNLVDIQLAETKPIDKSEKRVFSQRWHRDPGINGVIKIFVYFSDVDNESGPFEYLKQTHIKTSNKDNKLSRKRFFGGSFYPSEKQINYFIKNNNKSKKILDGKKGTIIIADTSGFHRGGFAKKGGRLMSTFVYYPYYDPIKSRLIANKICKSKLSTIQRDFLK